jgi:hypothetical protein
MRSLSEASVDRTAYLHARNAHRGVRGEDVLRYFIRDPVQRKVAGSLLGLLLGIIVFGGPFVCRGIQRRLGTPSPSPVVAPEPAAAPAPATPEPDESADPEPEPADEGPTWRIKAP